jgi:DNA (cytosine-5)-methyltransferase 1
MTQHRPIVIDLFAGVGGLSLGFEQAGFDIAAAVEFDPIHAATHKINFPRCATICRDVRTISGKEIREVAGIQNATIDVVVGGPPCQGFSLIGQRVLDDPRNSLVFHYLRLVRELKPRMFVMENVPGLATAPHTKLLTELIEGFEELGYRVRQPYQILNAANFGVPQNRRRVFLLGARRGINLPEYPAARTVPPPTERSIGSTRHLCTPLPSCPTTREAIEDLPDIERFESLYETDELKFKLNGGSNYALTLRGKIQDPTDYSDNRKYDPNLLTGCQRAEHTALSRKRFAATTPGTVEPISRFYRIHFDGICNTLRAGTATDRGAFSAPRPIHPAFARCISVREAARIHSYPDWFRFHRTIWHGFRQIGNSVPPRLGRAVGAEVMKALGVEPVKTRGIIDLDDTEMASFNMREAAAHFGVDRNVIHPRRRAASIGR